MEFNEKTTLREVICIKCRIIVRTSEADPHCLVCDNIMITTVRSIITDEVITGTPTDDKTYKV